MVKGSGDHMSGHGGGGVSVSSIALLQERFKQLQRMKELRQEKELLRMLSESDRRQDSPPPISHADHYHELQQKLTIPCPQLKSQQQQVPPKAQCQLLSLSLWPESQNKHAGSRELQEGPPISDLTTSWFADAAQLVCTSPLKLEHRGGCPDIDLSLRL